MCGIVGYIGKREAYPVLIKVFINLNTADMIPPGWHLLTTAA